MSLAQQLASLPPHQLQLLAGFTIVSDINSATRSYNEQIDGLLRDLNRCQLDIKLLADQAEQARKKLEHTRKSRLVKGVVKLFGRHGDRAYVEILQKEEQLVRDLEAQGAEANNRLDQLNKDIADLKRTLDSLASYGDKDSASHAEIIRVLDTTFQRTNAGDVTLERELAEAEAEHKTAHQLLSTESDLLALLTTAQREMEQLLKGWPGYCSRCPSFLTSRDGKPGSLDQVTVVCIERMVNSIVNAISGARRIQPTISDIDMSQLRQLATIFAEKTVSDPQFHAEVAKLAPALNVANAQVSTEYKAVLRKHEGAEARASAADVRVKDLRIKLFNSRLSLVKQMIPCASGPPTYSEKFDDDKGSD